MAIERDTLPEFRGVYFSNILELIGCQVRSDASGALIFFLPGALSANNRPILGSAFSLLTPRALSSADMIMLWLAADSLIPISLGLKPLCLSKSNSMTLMRSASFSINRTPALFSSIGGLVIWIIVGF